MSYNANPPAVVGPGTADVNFAYGTYPADHLIWPEMPIDHCHLDLAPFQEPYAGKVDHEPFWYAGNVVPTSVSASGSILSTASSHHHPHQQHQHQHHAQQHSHHHQQQPHPQHRHPALPPIQSSIQSEPFTTDRISLKPAPSTSPQPSASPESPLTDSSSSTKPQSNQVVVPQLRKPAGFVSGTSIICEWPTCNKVFTRWRDLNHHWLSHEKPFSCPTCGHRAATKTHLRRHTNTHRREEKYYCQYPGCYRSRSGPGKPFYRKDNCRNHMKDVHGLFEESNYA